MNGTLWTLKFLSHVIMDTRELDLLQGLVRPLEHGINNLQYVAKVD